MSAIDVTDRILQLSASGKFGELKRKPEDAPSNLHPQAAEMFIKMAEHAVHKIEGGGTDYEDYTVPVIGLALANCLVACEKSTVPPSFDNPLRPDPWVQTAFFRQMMAELNLEQAARLRHGIWRCWYDPKSDRAHHRLTRRRRQSALQLLDFRAQSALLQQLLGRDLSELSPDELYHALAASPEMLSFLTQTDPVGWQKFESTTGIDSNGMSAFVGFLVFLRFAADTVRHSYWYDEDFLIRLWNIYVQAYPQYASISGSRLLNVVREFSMAPSEAAQYLIHPPFFFLHGKFLRNPCFLGSNNPIATLLTIAIRKHERVWSQTLGSTLAKSSDTLGALLPQTARLKIAVRRKYLGGDVDLALYDTQTRQLFVCEVKTVYDKHRTDSLMHRFEEAKVNVDKAASQLRSTVQTITSGQLTLKQIFGINAPTPIKVHMALLTWLDPLDLTMDTQDENIFSLNFATFLWLVHASVGDVQALATAIHELRNLWTVAVTRPLDLGQPELTADLEVQTGLLDAQSVLTALPLSELCRRIIEKMPTIEESSPHGTPSPWVSYIKETRRALEQMA